MGEMVAAGYLSAFSGKKILITGHTGFKGSWLAFLLNEIGAEVLGYALPPNVPESHFEMLDLRNTIQHVEGDVRDGRALAAVMNEFQPEYVFHLAAQALVRPSYDDPVETFSTNIMGSINLLEAVRRTSSIRSLVYITSDKCYENQEWVWGYRENDRLGGHDPYSASKGAAEMVFSAYQRSFFSKRTGFGAATARAGNVIGGGDWSEDRIVPDCIRAIHSGKSIQLRNPSATRPWQHVLEPLSGYLLLALRLSENPEVYAGAWNFGPAQNEGRTVLAVAERIAKHFKYDDISIRKSATQYYEANLLQLNCDKANRLLKWWPRWDVEKTLFATADWYKQIKEGGKASDITRRQLQDYFPELL